jgi:hypothetical protein
MIFEVLCKCSICGREFPYKLMPCYNKGISGFTCSNCHQEQRLIEPSSEQKKTVTDVNIGREKGNLESFAGERSENVKYTKHWMEWEKEFEEKTERGNHRQIGFQRTGHKKRCGRVYGRGFRRPAVLLGPAGPGRRPDVHRPERGGCGTCGRSARRPPSERSSWPSAAGKDAQQPWHRPQ